MAAGDDLARIWCIDKLIVGVVEFLLIHVQPNQRPLSADRRDWLRRRRSGGRYCCARSAASGQMQEFATGKSHGSSPQSSALIKITSVGRLHERGLGSAAEGLGRLTGEEGGVC